MVTFCRFPTVQKFVWFLPLRTGCIIIAFTGIFNTVIEIIIGALFFDLSSVDIFFLTWLSLDILLTIGSILFLCGIWCYKEKDVLMTKLFMWTICLAMVAGVAYLLISVINDAVDYDSFAHLDFILHVISTALWFYFLVVVYSYLKNDLDDY